MPEEEDEVSLPLTRTLLRAWFLVRALLDLLVLTLAFVLVVTPYALLSRASGRDPLRLRDWTSGESSWCDRTDAVTDSASFRRQF